MLSTAIAGDTTGKMVSFEEDITLHAVTIFDDFSVAENITVEDGIDGNAVSFSLPFTALFSHDKYDICGSH